MKNFRQAFTLLELIVVIVILGLLAALAIPTFAGVIDKSKEEATLATLQAIAREAQALKAFDQGEWSNHYFEAAAADTHYAYEAGAFAAPSYVAVNSSTEDPKPGEIVYTINGDGVVLTILANDSKICAVGLNSTSIGDSTCLPPTTNEDGSNTGGTLSGGSISILPPGTVVGNPVVTPPVEPPVIVVPVAVPQNLNVSFTDPSANLSWDTVSDATAYNLYTGDGATEAAARIALDASTTPTKQVTTPNTQSTFASPGFQCYAVSAVRGASESARSGAVCAELVAPVPPSAVTSLAATASSSQVKLDWVAPVGTPVTNYRITVSPAASGGAVFDSASPTFTVAGLSNGTTYTFGVASQNGNLTSPAVTIVAAPTSAPSVVVSGLKYPGSMVELNGYMFIADQSNNAVKAVNLTTKSVTTLATITSPQEVVTDGTYIYARPYTGPVIKITVPASRSAGTVTSLSGLGTVQNIFSVDEVAYSWKAAEGLRALNSDGTSGPVLVPSTGLTMARGMTKVGNVFYFSMDGGVKAFDFNTKLLSNFTLAPVTATTIDGPPGTATFDQLHQIDTDGEHLYVSGYGDYKIRKISLQTGMTTTLVKGLIAMRSVQVVDSKVYYANFDGQLLVVDK